MDHPTLNWGVIKSWELILLWWYHICRWRGKWHCRTWSLGVLVQDPFTLRNTHCSCKVAQICMQGGKERWANVLSYLVQEYCRVETEKRILASDCVNYCSVESLVCFTDTAGINPSPCLVRDIVAAYSSFARLMKSSQEKKFPQWLFYSKLDKTWIEIIWIWWLLHHINLHSFTYCSCWEPRHIFPMPRAVRQRFNSTATAAHHHPRAAFRVAFKYAYSLRLGSR